MGDSFIDNGSVIDSISDDEIYIRELVAREKLAGINSLKQAHLGRLVTVFCYNSLESYRNVIVREEVFDSKELQWNPFFRNTPLTPYFERIVACESVRLQTLDNVLAQVEGLKALRDFISHGLTDESANRFRSKVTALQKIGLLKNPQHLQFDDVDRILALDEALTILMGMARALITSDRNKKT